MLAVSVWHFSLHTMDIMMAFFLKGLRKAFISLSPVHPSISRRHPIFNSNNSVFAMLLRITIYLCNILKIQKVRKHMRIFQHLNLRIEILKALYANWNKTEWYKTNQPASGTSNIQINRMLVCHFSVTNMLWRRLKNASCGSRLVICFHSDADW